MAIHQTRVIGRNKYAFNNGHRFIVHQGGTRSGKTFGNIICLFHLATSEPNILISIVSENIPHLKRGAIRDFKVIMYELGLQDQITENKQDSTFTFSNGSIIEFFAADNEGKARGAGRDYLFVNESNNIKWDIFYQLYIRTKRQIIIDYNPSGEFWWHTKLRPSIKHNEYLFTRTTYKDNPSLSPQIIKDIENLINVDENLYKIYAQGLQGSMEGLIFPEVGIINEYPYCSKKVYGLDFGFNDPTAMVEVGLHNGRIVGDEKIYDRGITNRDLSDRMDSLGILRNSIIIADCADPKSIEELNRMGWIVIPSKKGKDSVVFGIQLIKKYGIDITASSTNWIKEKRNYKWHKKNSEIIDVPVDNFNHCWDACRYAVGYLSSLSIRNDDMTGMGAFDGYN